MLDVRKERLHAHNCERADFVESLLYGGMYIAKNSGISSEYFSDVLERAFSFPWRRKDVKDLREYWQAGEARYKVLEKVGITRLGDTPVVTAGALLGILWLLPSLQERAATIFLLGFVAS